MEIEEVNWFGFKHESVKEKFEGSPEYRGTFAFDGGQTWAVYYCAKPNKEKGHKNYMMLTERYEPLSDESKLWVSGRTPEEMEKDRYQTGLHCLSCDTVIYSQNRHDMHPCKCRSSFKRVHVDGGKDYLRVTFGKDAKYKEVRIDLLERKIVPFEKKEDKKNGNLDTNKRIRKKIRNIKSRTGKKLVNFKRKQKN